MLLDHVQHQRLALTREYWGALEFVTSPSASRGSDLFEAFIDAAEAVEPQADPLHRDQPVRLRSWTKFSNSNRTAQESTICQEALCCTLQGPRGDHPDPPLAITSGGYPKVLRPGLDGSVQRRGILGTCRHANCAFC